jgi:histidinol-phosphate aminotransferase
VKPSAVPSPELLAKIESKPGYSVPSHPAPVDLYLASNEGRPASELPLPQDWLPSAATLARYPDTSTLRAHLATELGVAESEVLVTAGADDALFRACTATQGPNCEAVVPSPTFEMISRYVELARGSLRVVDWPREDFPLTETLAAITARTSLIVIVSPNNPTGQVISRAALARLSEASPHALLVLDLAYSEFADEDLTSFALRLNNVVVLRTFSKAWGLAGLRVGYAVGPQALISTLNGSGNPYPVSAASLALVEARAMNQRADMQNYVQVTRDERESLHALLERMGAQPIASQANFVFARCSNPVWIRDAFASLGIAIRIFPGREGLEDALRISCPGEAQAMERVTHALETACDPEALIWDMDGVLAEVSRSFRRAIIETAAGYDVELTGDDIDRMKAKGGANDDWELTQRLLSTKGVDAELTEVTERFEALYQGTESKPGLFKQETLLPGLDVLRNLAERMPMAIVTGRPRRDAERFLRDFDLETLFRVTICREDAPLKPDPRPVDLALEKLGVKRAWMLGDTPDDVRAARDAGVIPLGVVDFESEVRSDRFASMQEALLRAGAARVLTRMSELEELL